MTERQLRCLDVCCGAGGAAHGYAEAGLYVVGADINAALEHDYLRSGASEFITADARDVLTSAPFVEQFDFIHASPPCQRYSRMSSCRPGIADEYPDLIGDLRRLLTATGKPFVIENVVGAPQREPLTLCMYQFGREAYRHRWFETGGGLILPNPPLPPLGTPGPLKECGWPHPVPAAKAGHWTPGRFVSISGHERRGPVNDAMDIHWMRRREDVAESIPPCMTRWIGEQLRSPAPIWHQAGLFEAGGE